MGNCKCCLKPKTSDDVERQPEGQRSVLEQGKGQRSSIRSASSVAKSQKSIPPPDLLRNVDPATASARSVDKNSKVRTYLVDSNGPDVTRTSVRSTKGQGAAVPVVPRSKDAKVITLKDPDLERRSSSRTIRQKLYGNSPIGNKENTVSADPHTYSAYDDDGRQLMSQLKQKYLFKGDFSLSDICTIMWKEDDHLEFNKHYKFSRNNGLSCNLDTSFLAQHPTYAAFHNLLGCHNNEDSAGEILMAEGRFLAEVMKTRVMQICWAFLKQKKTIYSHLGKKDFVKQLRSIWFPDAFEHIFVGCVDEDMKIVKGLHNWLQYSLQFNKGNITYKKCMRQVERMMVLIQYKWNGCLKESGSMFIGTSPEFELSLYTLLYVASLDNNEEENSFECSFEDRKSNGNVTNQKLIEIKIIVDGNNRKLKTAFPVKKA